MGGLETAGERAVVRHRTMKCLVLLWRVAMIDKSWKEIEEEEQEHYSLALEVANLREQNKQLKETLKLIWETDALQLWAFEDPDGEGSIADVVRKCLGK